MSYDSGPGQPDPADPSGFPGPGTYGAPTGAEFAPPTGPYAGPGGPGGPYGPYGGPPRKNRTGLILGLAGGGLLVLVVLIGVVVALVVNSGGGGAGGDELDKLAAPKTLGRDPVPAEKSITARPADCGVSKATAKKLTPGATRTASAATAVGRPTTASPRPTSTWITRPTRRPVTRGRHRRWPGRSRCSTRRRRTGRRRPAARTSR